MSSQENSSQTLKPYLWGAVGILSVVALYSVFHSSSEKTDKEARNALYKAEAALESEFKALLPSPTPAPSPETKTDPKADPKAPAKKPAAPTVTAADIEFKKLNVDETFAKAVKGFEEVSQKYSGHRAAFDAQLKLGHLYLDHGNSEKAAQWFGAAAKSSPNSFEKASALLLEAAALENLQKTDEALSRLDQARAVGESSFTGEILLSRARLLEAAKKPDEAKKVYDEITKQLPNTQASRNAEAFKAKLSN